MSQRNAVMPPPPPSGSLPPVEGPVFGEEPDTDVDLPGVEAPRAEMITAPDFEDESPTDPTPVPPPPEPADLSPTEPPEFTPTPLRTILSPPPLIEPEAEDAG